MNNAMNTDAATEAPATAEILAIHPWERIGLGLAPFAFSHYSESKFVAAPGVPARPGSSCDACGASIMSVFHVTSADGKAFKVGCDCIAKLLHECATTAEQRAAAKLLKTARKAKRTAETQAKMNATRDRNKIARADFLAAHDGLEAALELDHPIISSIAESFVRFCRLTDNQIALVTKIANEIRNPKPAELVTDAPTGRVKFTGTVVKSEARDTEFGTQIKITVKVTTESGVWLAWGTAPTGLFTGDCILKGKQVEITATLAPGRDRHFALMSRPRGRVCEAAAPAAAA